LAETIILQTKKRLHLTKDSTLLEEEKSENIEIFKNFIYARTQGDNQTALH